MTHIDGQKAFYNEKWQDFSFANNYGLARCIAILQAIHELELNQPSIVDIGTGAGWLASILGQFGPTLGIELSDVAVNIARKRYPHIHFMDADIFNIDLSANSFDIAVSQEVIEHVEDQAAFLELNHRLLRKGGHIILTTPNARAMMCTDKETVQNWTNQPIENWLTISEMRQLLSLRFTDIKIRTIIPTSMPNKGMYRLFNNHWARGFLYKTHMSKHFNTFILKLGYGLHQIVTAKKC